MREYTLTYGIEEQERSLLLEVAVDNIAESEEVFILYTNFMETLNDRCATPVHLQDNDGMYIINYCLVHIPIELLCSCSVQL